MSVTSPYLTSRLRGFGTSIFSQMTALAQAHDAVNLGQGFPDDNPPAAVVDAAVDALRAGHNQYAPGPGVLPLREAIVAHQQRFYGLDYDPDGEVTVTFGATEAIAAALLALCEFGDEVVVLEPAYDAYTAVVAMAGAVERRVPLTPPQASPAPPGPDAQTDSQTDPQTDGWSLDVARLATTIGPRTRVLLLNSPHNPTGTVLDTSTLDAIARLCVEHDLIAITDEVYEHLVYDQSHVPLASRPGMRERTISVSSAGKTFSCTGWKIGWACAPPPLTAALRTTKQFLSFAGGTPLQHAIAVALASDDAVYQQVTEVHRRRRALLIGGLRDAGLTPTPAPGTYFVTVDVTPLGWDDGDAFCRWAPQAIGVAAVPVGAFVEDASADVRSMVRFAFCKPDEVIAEGMRRLGRHRVRT